MLTGRGVVPKSYNLIGKGRAAWRWRRGQSGQISPCQDPFSSKILYVLWYGSRGNWCWKSRDVQVEQPTLIINSISITADRIISVICRCVGERSIPRRKGSWTSARHDH